MSVPVRGVLFDLYGTLVDISTDEADPRLWRSLSLWMAEHLDRVVDPEELRSRFEDLTEREARVRGHGFALDAALLELLGPGAEGRDIRNFAQEFRKVSTVELSLRSYTRPLLSKLREQGLRLGLVSNTESLVTNYDINTLGLRDEFGTVVLSSAVGFAKPDPRIIRKALDALSLGPRSVVFVGDTPATDIDGARSLGMRSVLVSSTPASEALRSSAGVVVVPPRCDDIYAAILGQSDYP